MGVAAERTKGSGRRAIEEQTEETRSVTLDPFSTEDPEDFLIQTERMKTQRRSQMESTKDL